MQKWYYSNTVVVFGISWKIEDCGILCYLPIWLLIKNDLLNISKCIVVDVREDWCSGYLGLWTVQFCVAPTFYKYLRMVWLTMYSFLFVLVLKHCFGYFCRAEHAYRAMNKSVAYTHTHHHLIASATPNYNSWQWMFYFRKFKHLKCTQLRTRNVILFSLLCLLIDRSMHCLSF